MCLMAAKQEAEWVLLTLWVVLLEGTQHRRTPVRDTISAGVVVLV
jgi:hypothetical protein